MTDMQIARHYACLVGDVRTLRTASYAMSAIIDVLQDESTATNAHRRGGLLTALELVARSMDERAEFLAYEVLGEEGE